MRARASLALAVAIASGAPIAHANTPPPRIVSEAIGRSAQDRPIGVTRVRPDDGAVRRRVLVVGCVHGDECAGRAIVARLRTTGGLPTGSELLLVANLNPDGFALGRRQNARGVDLNRNSSAGHRDLGPPGSPTYAGPRPWSESESRAIRELILRTRPDVVVWYHQPLAGVDVPETGWHGRARRYGRLVGLRVRPLPAYPGSLSRWVNERVRPGSSFVVELPCGRLRPAEARRHAAAIRVLAGPA